MTITHRLARACIAPIFISGGIDAFRNPHERAKKADPVSTWIADALGLSQDPVMLVKINGAIQAVAGSMLVVGRAPRLASAALSASLVPTTIAGHAFWEEQDPELRAQQRTQLFKNLAMLGGLVLAATDTDGAPSIRWRAKRAARSAAHSAAETAAHTVALATPHGGTSKRNRKAAQQAARHAAQQTAQAARDAQKVAVRASVIASRSGRSAGRSVLHSATGLLDTYKPTIDHAASVLSATVAHASDVVAERASALTH